MNKVIKKCIYCNTEYETCDSWTTDMYRSWCNNCIEIYKLDKVIDEYIGTHKIKEYSDEIYKRNLVIDESLTTDEFTTFFSIKSKKGYRVEKRNKEIRQLIENIEYAREFLEIDISAQLKILDSLYETKNIFWEESGNLHKYVHEASFEYVVIKLKELLSSKDSKYSIIKLKNIFTNDKKRIFDQQKVYEITEYENGDSFENLYDPFPISDYMEEIESTLLKYSGQIKAISDFRDNKFAHIAELKDGKSSENLTYDNLKRIYNMLKVIYRGYLLSIAPDKYVSIVVEHNINFSNLDKIVKEYRNTHKKRT